MKRETSTAAVITACLVLILLPSLAGCGSEPTPLIPTPIPSPTTGATATPTLSPSPSATPSPTVVPLLSRINPLRPDPLVQIRTADLAEALRTVVGGTYCSQAWSGTALPATLALPVEPVNGDLLLEWNSSAPADYITAPGAPRTVSPLTTLSPRPPIRPMAAMAHGTR